MSPRPAITADLLLRAYAAGIFPMSEGADDPTLFWVDPERRGVIPLENLHVPRRLARTVRQDPYEIRVDSAFEAVIDGCAAAAPDRPDTWINRRIRALCIELHGRGHAHSIEAWRGGELVGGLYGIALGGAFFGESMFSRARDASKIALLHLVARLRAGGFVLLDAQFLTDHLAQFGTCEIDRAAYRERLSTALAVMARWPAEADLPSMTGTQVLQWLAASENA